MNWRKIGLAVAVFVLLLELVLQVGAVLASTFVSVPQSTEDASVVCLGDSYTHGIGASSPEMSYPAQLEQRLHEAGHDVVVANGGFPGKDSAFMVQRLPLILGPNTKVLCILMAYNDTWSQPGLIDINAVDLEAEVGSTFVWRWRTARLLALCFGFQDNSWYRTVDEVAVDEPAIGEQSLLNVEAGYKLLEQIGMVSASEPPPVLAPQPSAATQKRIYQIEGVIREARYGAALLLAKQLANEFATDPAVVRTLAVAEHKAGHEKESGAVLESLSLMADQGDLAAKENYIIALLATDHVEQSLNDAKAYAAEEPRSLVACIAGQEATYLLGNFDEYRRDAPRVLLLLGRLMAPQSAAISRRYAAIIDRTQPVKAAKLMIAATLLDGNRAQTRARMPNMRKGVTWDQFSQAIDAATLADEETRNTLRVVMRSLYEDDLATAPWKETLREHVLDIGQFCVDRGIKIVIMEYPFPHPELERVQRDTAAKLGAEFVPVRKRFDQELKTRSRDELFVRNGHCTDEGYALMAELVAKAVGPLLKR